MLSTDEIPRVLLPFVREFAGGEGGQVVTLGGDASTRRYHRVQLTGGRPPSVMVMELPPDALRSDEATSADQPAELSFLNVQRFLESGGLPVPRIFKVDMRSGLLALEDLGDRTFESAVRGAGEGARKQLYRDAMALIVRLQRLGDSAPDAGCVAFGRRFDQPLLRWELDHFRQWLLKADRGVKLAGGEAAVVDETFDWLSGVLAESPATLVHRDFQSRNLMIVDDASDGRGSIRIIDFQDALLGSRAYDLVALLRDSYVELDPAEVSSQVDAFCELAGIPDRPSFRTLFYRQTLQRKLKDAGRFVFIDRVRKNPAFLRWIPASLAYVRDALGRVPEAARLQEVLARHVQELR